MMFHAPTCVCRTCRIDTFCRHQQDEFLYNDIEDMSQAHRELHYNTFNLFSDGDICNVKVCSFCDAITKHCTNSDECIYRRGYEIWDSSLEEDGVVA